HLLDKAENLVIVSNDIFSDGNIYDEMTRQYISNMGKINQCLAERADKVLELVCGIPIYHK
nr:bifunctional adenosylcobinamide kinase/adenosylcobinamide-phosphate guanylyltransferase [Lachnospiraceae bacterium]